MNAIVSFFLSLFCIFSGITGAFVRTGSPKAVSDDFVPVLRFMAASDIHIHDLGDKKCMRLIKGIRSAYKIAESDPDYTALDAVCLTGDVTDNGRKDQYLALASILRNEIKGKTQPMIVQAKSHDCNTLGREALDYLSGITGQPNDYHYTVNGFHFIGTSASHDPDVHYDDKQLSRLDELLSAATAEDPDKPVFVFQHEHIKDTVFGSYDEDGWGVNYFNDILNKYPQVIDISGHSHYPANDPKAVWQGAFTAINDGGMAYYEFTFEGQRSYHPDDSRKMAQMLLVEVDANNRVLVRVYDVTAEKFIYEYLIDNVTEADKTKFSHETRRSAASAPEFAESAEITIKNIFGQYVFSVPQAKAADNDIVFDYRLSITNTAGEEIASTAALSKYYLAEVPERISFDKLKLGKGSYTAVVTAVDAWGFESEPITLDFNI